MRSGVSPLPWAFLVMLGADEIGGPWLCSAELPCLARDTQRFLLEEDPRSGVGIYW